MKQPPSYEPPPDSLVESDLAEFAVLLRVHYGERLKGAWLFGSRARGEAGPESDADVAVVLDQVDEIWKEVKALSDLSFDFLVRDGVYIEAKPVAWEAWNDPALHRNPSLVRAMKRDGRAVGVVL